MPEIGTPKFDAEGTEHLDFSIDYENFPNDREPTEEELEVGILSDQWLQEKGPWFAACYLTYNDGGPAVTKSRALGEVIKQIFPELKSANIEHQKNLDKKHDMQELSLELRRLFPKFNELEQSQTNRAISRWTYVVKAEIWSRKKKQTDPNPMTD